MDLVKLWTQINFFFVFFVIFLYCRFRLYGCEQQFWNDAASGGDRLRPRPEVYDQPEQRIDSSYAVVENFNAPKKNCTGSGGNCIPKCFAEKGNRGFPGMSGVPGQRGSSTAVNIWKICHRFDTKNSAHRMLEIRLHNKISVKLCKVF